MSNWSPRRVLFVGHSYYNTWYLSRELRKLGWKADALNTDVSADPDSYYHGQDFRFKRGGPRERFYQLFFFAWALFNYDIFHFSGAWNLAFVTAFDRLIPYRWDIKLLRLLGKKIVYSNNSCMDGVLQSSFAQWGPESVCAICVWRDRPDVCGDDRNRRWGEFRNQHADYQVTLGGNRKDFNLDPRVHEEPGFYCLDPDVWRPDLLIPTNYRLPFPESTVKIYHSVGNFESRTAATSGQNIKSTHIYLPLIEQLKAEGHPVELIFFHDVPNKKVRYYQAQADIVVDMLTFGFFGANVREALMLGKPVICYLRPEWLESMRDEIPEYVDELPVVSATPSTVHAILEDLVKDADKRRELGRRGREFAVKWHSSAAGAARFDRIYRELLSGTPHE